MTSPIQDDCKIYEIMNLRNNDIHLLIRAPDFSKAFFTVSAWIKRHNISLADYKLGKSIPFICSKSLYLFSYREKYVNNQD